MGILCWRDIVDMLWSISAGLNFIHGHGLVHGNLHGGNILVECDVNSIDTKITDTGLHWPADKSMSFQQIYGCLDVNPLNRPAASQLYEYFGNWISEICDSPDPSDLSNQFDAAEEIKFSNLKNFDFNIAQCHEMAIYYSRPLLDYA
ncbi:unnamed protein product [Rhizophagus irregularis]|uniref:Protein kinase domain-containing protein n=1 Tax=Rhizophagus irregularis TaxID=588596 RepID=A0A916E263_9GLOM|nr:unnamed protein product [Rhizophagus irregularis]